MTLTPLGLSVGRSVSRIVAIASYMIGAIVTIVGTLTVTATNDVRISHLADLGAGIMLDSSWLLPALLAVNVTLIAVVAAQSFAGTGADQVARTHGVIAVVSQMVSGFALLVMVLSTISAATTPETARHLVSVYFLALLVVFFGLWASVVVFGNPKEALRISEASRHLSAATLQRLHQPTHTRKQAWATLVGSVAFITLATTTIPLLLSYIEYGTLAGARAWALTCLGVAVFACFTAALGCVVWTLTEPRTSAWIFYLTVVVPLSLTPATVVVLSHAQTSPTIVAAIAFGFVAPIVLSWTPYGHRQNGLDILGMGNAIRSLTYLYVTTRLQRIDAHIVSLRRDATALDMSAARER